MISFCKILPEAFTNVRASVESLEYFFFSFWGV